MNLRLLLALAAGYGTLVVYASLYPFGGWRTDGVAAFGFLTHGLTVVAPRIDSYVNVLAYLPLGLLFALCVQGRVSFPMRVIVATLAALSLSFSMEFLQQFLPRRIASPADLAANTCGALFGALLSSLFDAERLPGRLVAQWRERWVKPGPQYSLGLTVLAAWALSQWLPGLPSFSIASVRAGLAPLWHTALDLPSFDLLQWGRYSLYLSGLALLAKTLANPGRRAVAAFFIFVAVVFAYKVTVVGRHISLEAVAGALCAMLLTVLWLAQRVRTMASIAAFLILGGLLCAHVLPGQSSAQHLSNWRPLLGPIDHPVVGLGSVLEILWPSAALGYLGHIAAPAQLRRVVAWAGGAAFGLFILLVGWPERSVPIATALLMGAAWTVFGSIFTASTAAAPSQPKIERERSASLVHRLAITFAAVILTSSYSVDSVAASSGQRLLIGPQHVIKSPSAAAQVAGDGDVVEIEAALYAGDVAVWVQNDLTIRGIGGRPHLRADGANAEGKAIWVIKGANTRVENIEFSGARVSDRNGAGIRLEGPGLVIRNCHFHHNENGILTAPHVSSDVVIEHSEFNHNGAGDGQSHNIYIGTVRSFTLRHSYVHHAIVGHNVKSRSLRNVIEHNRILDERDGRASYAIDLPNGGVSFIVGNVLHKGPNNESRTMVSYGAEGYRNPGKQLYLFNNTLINDAPARGRFVSVRSGADIVVLTHNIFTGAGEMPDTQDNAGTNIRVPRSAFLDPDKFDYRLKASAAAGGRGAERAAAPAIRP